MGYDNCVSAGIYIFLLSEPSYIKFKFYTIFRID
jgi:hypothetical protein